VDTHPHGRSRSPLPRRAALLGASCLSLGLVALVSAGSGPPVEPGEPGGWAGAERVLLHRRVDNDEYGKSAYSFRYRTQDVDVHRNEVDLIFNRCGSLHVDGGGAANQVARVDVKQLDDLTESPDEGWFSECFQPEEKAVYVMQVSDETRRYLVSFRILDVKEDRVLFEWQPFDEPPGAKRGYMGNCGGTHTCK